VGKRAKRPATHEKCQIDTLGDRKLLWAEGPVPQCPTLASAAKAPLRKRFTNGIKKNHFYRENSVTRALERHASRDLLKPRRTSRSGAPSRQNCKLPWNELPLAQTWRRADLAGAGCWATPRLTPCLPICIIVCKWKWYLKSELISWELADRPLLLDNLPPNSSWARIGIRRHAGEPELDMPTTAMISLCAGADGCGGHWEDHKFVLCNR